MKNKIRLKKKNYIFMILILNNSKQLKQKYIYFLI